MTQYGFYVNSDICTGCKACMTACMDRNNLQGDEKLRKVYEFGGGEFTKDDTGAFATTSFSYYVSLTCQHCEAPACMIACPEKAISKTEAGIVYIDDEKCQGHGDCIEACPYHHPTWNADQTKAKKCVLCTDETTEDGVPNPACAKACPVRALEFGPIEDLRKKYGENVKVAIFDDTTKPNVVINPHRSAEKGGDLMNPLEVNQA